MKNFIDKAFENKLRGDDFLQAMADIYSEPDVEMILHKYPQFVKDVIIIIDYDTVFQMEGLEDVLWGSMEEKFSELLMALVHCGAKQDADILRKAKNLTEEQENEFEDLKNKLAFRNDYEAFWDLVREYINQELDKI